jgi:hypothetical protein
LQLSFGEAFQHKHIVVFDTETSEKEYVRNTFSPQHFIVPANEVYKYSLKNNFIRVMVDDLSAAEVVEMRRNLIEKDVGTVEMKQKPVILQEANKIEMSKTLLLKTNEMLNKYLESIDLDGLEKKKLLELGKSICESDLGQLST